jgi:hypothetical protein
MLYHGETLQKDSLEKLSNENSHGKWRAGIWCSGTTDQLSIIPSRSFVKQQQDWAVSLFFVSAARNKAF